MRIDICFVPHSSTAHHDERVDTNRIEIWKASDTQHIFLEFYPFLIRCKCPILMHEMKVFLSSNFHAICARCNLERKVASEKTEKRHPGT